MFQALLIGAGGAVGSVLRYYVGVIAVRLAGPAFPWGTLAVNVLGSFAIGVLTEMIIRRFDASNDLRLLLVTGLLGGFTTFSSFSLDAVMLVEKGAGSAAVVYLVASLVLSLLATVAGLTLARAVF